MIKELIVVEGKNDAQIVRKALGEVNIIWTEGFGLTKEKLAYIKESSLRTGVVILTDPDTVGEQIRAKIAGEVPEAKHVYISKKNARKNGDIGVENAAVEEIRRAFAHIQEVQDLPEVFTVSDMIEAELMGNSESAEKRRMIGRKLGLGDANAKQFLQRLNRFGIDREIFWQAVKEVSNGKRG